MRSTPVIALALLAACSDPSGPIISESLRSWLDSSAPLAAVEPIPSTADLAPLGAFVGNARLIGFGEDTHGTHQFFTMKNRAFQYLVQEKGVTAFAIEATMPEAFALDTYVRTGKGDPAVLLSHLYFWTWNTQEVRDLIDWLRQYDIDHPAAQVGFYGFDMQYPGIAIDSLLHFAARVSPALTDTLSADLACLAPYRNDAVGHFPATRYSAVSSAWQTCAPRVAAAYDYLNAGRSAYIAATSSPDFELALQMARLVIQWEQVSRSANTRDAAMAENASWLLGREGATGKVFLWAHNFHISRQSTSMGSALAAQWGANYVPIGFAFGSGGFNAVEMLGNGTFGFLKTFVAPSPRSASFEEVFATVAHDNFFMNLRDAPADVGAWLNASRPMRSIGAVYSPSQDAAFYASTKVQAQFDGLIFVRSTTSSLLLPFKF